MIEEEREILDEALKGWRSGIGDTIVTRTIDYLLAQEELLQEPGAFTLDRVKELLMDLSGEAASLRRRIKLERPRS